MKLRLTIYLWWQVNKGNINILYIWNLFWAWVKPYLTLKMIPIVLSLWLLTNGIWYIIGFVPFSFIPASLSSFARWYIGFLYTPIAMEKFLILYLAKVIYKAFYKDAFIPIYRVKLIRKYDYKHFKKEVAYDESQYKAKKC